MINDNYNDDMVGPMSSNTIPVTSELESDGFNNRAKDYGPGIAGRESSLMLNSEPKIIAASGQKVTEPI